MSKKVFKFVKNGRVINQEKANIAFYGYVRGRFMDRVDFYDGYIDEQIGENEFIVPIDDYRSRKDREIEISSGFHKSSSTNVKHLFKIRKGIRCKFVSPIF